MMRLAKLLSIPIVAILGGVIAATWLLVKPRRMPLPGGSWSKSAKGVEVVALLPDGSDDNKKSRDSSSSSTTPNTTFLLKANLRTADGPWEYDEIMFQPSKNEEFVNYDGLFLSKTIYDDSREMMKLLKRQRSQLLDELEDEKSVLDDWDVLVGMLPGINLVLVEYYKGSLLETREELSTVKGELWALHSAFQIDDQHQQCWGYHHFPEFNINDGQFETQKTYEDGSRKEEVVKRQRAKDELKAKGELNGFDVLVGILPVINLFLIRHYKFNMVMARTESSTLKAQVRAQENELKAKEKELYRLKKELAKYKPSTSSRRSNDHDHEGYYGSLVAAVMTFFADYSKEEEGNFCSVTLI